VSTAVDASSTLSRDGLSEEQLLHFAEHGWVLLEEAIDPDLCLACCEATERIAGRLTAGRTSEESDRGNTTGFREPFLHEPVFLELYKTPGLIAAARQIIGHDDVRYMESVIAKTTPDPERRTRPEVVGDRRTWGWHRSFLPRDIITPHRTDPRLINCALVAIGMYLVPIAPEHGVTAFFDKSHEYDGELPHGAPTYDDAANRFEVVQPTAGVGSIVMFSEVTVHSPAPVLSEQTRYAHFGFIAVPWFHRVGEQPFAHASFADDDLRSIFAPCVNDNPVW
jgi:hypothetical protein